MSTPNADLILHLNFDEVVEVKVDGVVKKGVKDVSGKGNDGTIMGTPQLVSDDEFGSCLSFDGKGDHIALPADSTTDYSQGLTFEAWVFYNSFNSWSRVFDFGDGPGSDNLLLANIGTTGNLTMQVFQGGANKELVAPGSLKTGEWMHLAGTVNQGGDGVLYLNGEKVAQGQLQAPLRRQRRNNYIGKSNWAEDANFHGKLASARVYNRALSAAEVRQDMLDDQTASASFRASYPLSFKLYDREDNEQVIYITDQPDGRDLSLEISNTSRKAVTLAAPSAAVSADHHHLELRLRPGTLSETALARLALNGDGWSLLKPTPAEVEKNGGHVSLYFLSKSELTLNPSDTVSLQLKGVAADAGAGARGTRAELNFRRMSYPGDPAPLKGSRVQHLNVVNHRGQKTIPLHVGFLDSDTVLNDGTSANQLKLRITNVSRQPLALTPEPSNRASTLVISFDTRGDKETGKEWALGTSSQVGDIKITAPGWTLVNPGAQKEAITPEWIFKATKNALAAGEAIELTLSPVVSSLPSGLTNMYVRYQNIPGHWDGQFVVAIEKSPIVYRGDKVCVGTNTPDAKLHVASAYRNALKVQGSEKGGTWFGLQNTSAGGETWNVISTGADNSEGAGKLLFKTGETGSITMALDKAGNVGVGTDKPDTKLHVASEIGRPLKLASANVNGTWVTLNNTSAGGEGWNVISTGANNSEGAGKLLFKTAELGSVHVTFDKAGNVQVGGQIAARSKSFKIDHPVKADHHLVHACLEGPELGVYYRGAGRLAGGAATVKLPEYFEALTLRQDRTVTLTAKGREPYLLSYEEISDGEFKVYGTKPDGEFCWEVKAVRADVEHLQVEVRKRDSGD